MDRPELPPRVNDVYAHGEKHNQTFMIHIFHLYLYICMCSLWAWENIWVAACCQGVRSEALGSIDYMYVEIHASVEVLSLNYI